MRTDTAGFAKLLAIRLNPESRGLMKLTLLHHFGFKHTAEINALLALIFERDTNALAHIAAAGTDGLFLDALIASVNPKPAKRIHEVGEDFDFFHAVRDDPEWSLIRVCNFWVRNQKPAEKKIAIVTSMRNEGINIIEWLAHYRLLGIDDFFIYVNDNDDGSSELLALLAEHGVIQLIHNTTALCRDGGDMFPIQAKIYGHACEILAETRDFEWLFFTDPDEFLITGTLQDSPDMHRPLDDLFARLEHGKSRPTAVAFHWKIFTSQCEFNRKPGLNFERFTHYSPSDHVKTIVRNGSALSFSTSHLPRMPHGAVVLDGALNPIAAPDFKMKTVFGYGQVNHYWSKSFEEFIAKSERCRGDRHYSTFFDFFGNRHRGPAEAVPPLWISRVKSEIKALQSLPGIAAACRNVEVAFAAQLKSFDRDNDSEALFYRHFVKEI